MVNTESVYQAVTVTNTGGSAVAISSVALTGANETQFVISSNYCPASLAAGANCVIHLHFYPNATGADVAALTITDNASGSPQAVALTGTGVTPPAVSLSATSLAFGNVLVKTESVYQGVTLTNTGGSPLTISSVALTGTNLAQYLISSNTCPASLAAGANCVVHLHFYPQVTGAASAALTFTDNAAGSPQSVSLTGTGLVPAAASLSATSLAFGNVLVKTESVYQGVTLTNTGGGPLTISSVALTGTNLAQYVISSNTCPASLAAGANCVIHLHFYPQVTGAASAALTITDNAAGSPQSVALTGTGLTPAAVSLSATSLAFGNVLVKTESVYQGVTLTNTGGSPLTISSVALTGTNLAQYVISSNACPASLAAGANCVIHLHFYPQVTGAASANLTFTDNAAGSPQSVALTGTGVTPAAASLSVTSLAFGGVVVKTESVYQGVTLTNTGGSPLTISSVALTGTNPAQYLISSNTCPASLAAGANCVIHLHFYPQVTGAASAALTFADSATGSPQSVALTGTGIASLQITGTTPPSGTVGINYPAWPMGISGGTSPYNWSVSAGVLPPGLNLSPGTISGMPQSGGTFNFTVKVTDSSSTQQTATAAMSITIASPTLILPSSLSFPNGTVGQSYSSAINASGSITSTSGTYNYIWTVNGTSVPTDGSSPVTLSDGIAFTNSGGWTLSIGGTPTSTVMATFNVTVTACTPSMSGCQKTSITAGPVTYAIAVNPAPGSQVHGQIYLNNGCGNNGTLPPVKVSINTNPVQTTTTDNNGNYGFSNVPAGTFTVTPSITGPSSIFYPVSQPVVVNGNGANNNPNFSVSLGYTVSGTVDYNGSKTGRVYLATGNNCGNPQGTSISGKGSFTIRGVPPGNLTLQAWMDNLGYGGQNASNPTGSSSVTVSSTNLTGVTVTLNDAAAVTLTSAPSLQNVSAFEQGVLVPFNAIQNNNGVEMATSYNLEWSNSPSFTSPGNKSFAATGANGSGIWTVRGLSDGSSYYFRAQGVAGSSISPWSSAFGPVTIGAPKVGNSVSGTVTFTGTATGPLYAGFYDQNTNNVYVATILDPVSPQAYTVDVPTGSNYQMFGIVDQNQDGMVDTGDISNTGSHQSKSVVISGPTTGENETLHSANSVVSLVTQHYRQTNQNGTSDNYQLGLDVGAGVKLPAAVALVSGPNVLIPMDIGQCNNCGQDPFNFWIGLNSAIPKVGDAYGLQVTYSDGSSETLTPTVTTVLNAFATGLSPTTGTGTSTTPTFSWTDPASASSYSYTFNLWDSNGNQIWSIPGNNVKSNGFSNATTSIVWGTDPTNSSNPPSVGSLTSGMTYTWTIQATDSKGNTASIQVNYQP
jgi:hypothetical protein